MTHNGVEKIFWINGKSVANFTSDMADAATYLRLERFDSNLPSAAAAAVKRWMESDTNATWLMVIDDAGPEAIDGNDYNLSTDSNNVGFGQWIPRSSLEPKRIILITTSNRRIAQRWCHDKAIFLISPLETEDAVKFLRDRSADTTSSEMSAKKLVERFERHPSAITAAAAYIRENDMNEMTIDRYLIEFDQDQIDLMPTAINSRLSPALNPISPFASWLKTFQRIDETERQAISILALMCCLDQVHISQSMLLHAFEWSSTTILEASSVLLNYNIITKDMNKFYTIPRLVQQAARHWFKSKPGPGASPLNSWQFRALNCLIKEYECKKPQPGGSSIQAYLQQCHLLSHINEFRLFCKVSSERDMVCTDPQAAGIISFASLYMSEGEYRYAESLLLFVLNQKNLDPLLRAVAKVDLGESLRSRSAQDRNDRRLKKATDIVRDARDIITQEMKAIAAKSDVEEEKPTLEHIDSILYLQIYPCFARLYSDRRNFKRAAYFQDLVIRYYQTNERENDITMVGAILDRSSIYWLAGDAEWALKFQLKALEKLRTKPLSEDPDVESRRIEVQAALVRSYYSLREVDIALLYAYKVCNGRLKLFGESHIKTLEAERDLSVCLEDAQKLEEAKSIVERVLNKWKEKFGPEHLDVLQLEARLNRLNEELEKPPISDIEKAENLDPDLGPGSGTGN